MTMKNLALVGACLIAALAAEAQGVVTRPITPQVEPENKSSVEFRPISLNRDPAAGVQPLAFSLLPALETPAPDWAVSAFRFNLLIGQHHSVSGVDFGLLANLTDDELSAFSLAGLFNDCGMSDSAFTLAGVFNHASWDFTGLQIAAGMNYVEGVMTGVQVSIYNRTPRLSGLQVGAVNVIEKGVGMQVGVINSADVLRGVQIGAINLIHQSSFPFWPIVNCAF